MQLDRIETEIVNDALDNSFEQLVSLKNLQVEFTNRSQSDRFTEIKRKNYQAYAQAIEQFLVNTENSYKRLKNTVGIY